MVRTILILLVLWLLLRMVMRARQPGQPGPRRSGPAQGPQRPKGDVRIERIDPAARGTGRSSGSVQDADYEVVE